MADDITEARVTGEPSLRGREVLGLHRLVVLFLVVFLVHALSPSVQVTDSRLSVPTAFAIVTNRTLSLDDVPSVDRALRYTDYDVVRVNDRTLPFFPWPPMMFMVPAVWAAKILDIDVGTMRPSGPNRTYVLEQPTAAFLVALTAVVIALIALGTAAELGAQRRRRVTRIRWYALSAALLFAFGTSAWSTASRSMWAATPAMLFVALSLLAAQRSARGAIGYLWPLGAVLALSAVMRPTAAAFAAPMVVWAAITFKANIYRTVLAGLGVLLPFAIVNVKVYGALLPPYWNGSRVGSEQAISFVNAFAAHLISPSRGLLVYTSFFLLIPVALVMKYRLGKLSTLDVTAAISLALAALIIGGYGSTGGSSYGNRFFTEFTPVLMFLVLTIWYRALVTRDLGTGTCVMVGAVVLASVFMSATGATTRSSFCWSASPTFIDADPSRMWDFSDPQFLRPYRDLADGKSVRAVLIGSCEGAVVPAPER